MKFGVRPESIKLSLVIDFCICFLSISIYLEGVEALGDKRGVFGPLVSGWRPMRSLSVIRLRVVRSLRWWRFEWARRVEIPVVIVISLFIVLVRSVEPFAGLKRGATGGRASSRSRSQRQGSFRLMLLRLVMGFLGRLLLVRLDWMFGLPVGIRIWLMAVRIVSVLFRLLVSIVLQPRIALRGRVEFRSWASLSGGRATKSLILRPM